MNISETLDLAVQLTPDAVAVQSGSTTWSYRALGSRAMDVAYWLSDRGVGHGDVVGIVQGHSPEFVAVLYGALALGATVVPLNTRARARELAGLLDHAAPSVLVIDERYADIVRDASDRVSLDPIQVTTSFIAGLPSGHAEFDAAEVTDDAVAMLLFTSGTTGRPKPVALTHGGLTTSLLRSTMPPDGTPRGGTILAVPNHHVAGISALLSSVFSGRGIALLPAFSGRAWLDLAAETDADHAFVVPTMLQRILAEPAFEETDLSRLRTLAYGAAPMPRALIGEALRRFPTTTGFVASYGQTETGGTICILTPDDHEQARGEDPVAVQRLGSIGRPIDGAQIAILAEGENRPLGANTLGEIAVRLPERADDTWLRTGDLGYADRGGYVYLTSRRDDLIIRGGENIDPVEVEHVLLTHPDVADAAVAGVPDTEWGQVVAAFVVPKVRKSLTADQVVMHVKQSLASFKAPSLVVFVDELPRTALGKLRRQELVRLRYQSTSQELNP